MVDHIGKITGKSLRRAAGCGGVRRWSHGLYEAPVDPADASPPACGAARGRGEAAGKTGILKLISLIAFAGQRGADKRENSGWSELASPAKIA